MFSSRYLLAALIVLAFPFAAAAQTPTTDIAGAAPAAAPAPETPAGPRRVEYGVRFGPSFTTLSNVGGIDVTAAAAAFEPTLNFGGFINMRLTGSMSFQPEVLFAAKGHRIRDVDAAPVTTLTGEVKFPPADRVILVRYLEVPMLLRLSRQTHENTSLYLLGGPAFALRRNAVIREVADAGRHEKIDDLVSGSDVSYIFGAGAQHRRWLVDARFTRGMRNVGTQTATAPVKTGAFSVLMGVRF
ncbi:MAG TPA: porin family protein [Vicinamibacterales bacterium]|nr:porin family protein [Vicinamibacterales bacterium]